MDAPASELPERELPPRDAPVSFFDIVERRRAVRSYLPDRVEDGAIRTLLGAAVLAPTAINLEPWVFVVVQDRDRLERYSDRAKQLGRAELAQLRGTGGGEDSAHLSSLLEQPDFNIFYDAGTLIAIGARPLGRYATADCWLAAENLMLAACALGLGTCCVGLAIEVLNTPEVKAELDIPVDVTMVAPIIVGLPRFVPPAVPRKPPTVLSWK